MRALRARAVGKRGVLGVHVLCGIFRLWIRLALGLRDGAFDLVGKRCAERIEVCLGHARREQVRVRALHRVLRAPLLDLLLGPIPAVVIVGGVGLDRKSTRLNSSHRTISYAVFCLPTPPPRSTLFPYTTLFRSSACAMARSISSASDARSE